MQANQASGVKFECKEYSLRYKFQPGSCGAHIDAYRCCRAELLWKA
jgi:hypothetical protein